MNDFSGGIIVGVLMSLALGFIMVSEIADAQTPETWCESIAEASKTEPYKVVYDRCYVEYKERKKK